MRDTSEQVVEQQRHVLHLALDDVVRPALLRFRRVEIARNGRGLPDGRQRIAQFMRQRCQELILAAVGLEQLALVTLSLRDVGEPDGDVLFERRGHDVIPGMVAIGGGLTLHLQDLARLERLGIHLEASSLVPGMRQHFPHTFADVVGAA